MKASIRKFLCRLGLHEWSHFTLSPEFMRAFPERSRWGRECVHCDRLQYMGDDRSRWDEGVRGTLYVSVSPQLPPIAARGQEAS